jgi:hypothetical protein
VDAKLIVLGQACYWVKLQVAPLLASSDTYWGCLQAVRSARKNIKLAQKGQT